MVDLNRPWWCTEDYRVNLYIWVPGTDFAWVVIKVTHALDRIVKFDSNWSN